MVNLLAFTFFALLFLTPFVILIDFAFKINSIGEKTTVDSKSLIGKITSKKIKEKSKGTSLFLFMMNPAMGLAHSLVDKESYFLTVEDRKGNEVSFEVSSNVYNAFSVGREITYFKMTYEQVVNKTLLEKMFSGELKSKKVTGEFYKI